MNLKSLTALAVSFTLFWLVAGIAMIDILIAAASLRIANAPVRRIRKAVSARQALWSGRLFRWICAIMRIKVKMDLPDRDRQAPAIIVMNHQNFFDVLVVGGFIPRTGRYDTRWVIKKDVLKVPFIGWMARLSGCMPLARRRDAGDLELLATQGREFASEGASLLIFVEGHRFTKPKEGSAFKRVLPPKHAGFEALIEALPEYGALDVTVGWEPPLPYEADNEFKKLVLLYGRTLHLHGRLADPAAIQVPGWIDRAWHRKEECLARLSARQN